MPTDIERRIERIAIALPILVERLREFGFEFYHPDRVLPGVESDVEASIARIESDIGPVPAAVAQFWRRIGSVDLTGSHPDWRGCKHPDGLVVEPASLAVEELEEFLADREERMAASFPYAIPIAPDAYHKEDESGGMWYNVKCPATADDPLVNDERHKLTFLDYLEYALTWGGYPGLDRSRKHTWPVKELASCCS